MFVCVGVVYLVDLLGLICECFDLLCIVLCSGDFL